MNSHWQKHQIVHGAEQGKGKIKRLQAVYRENAEDRDEPHWTIGMAKRPP